MAAKVKRWFKKTLWKKILESAVEASPGAVAIALVSEEGPFLQLFRGKEELPGTPPDLKYPLTIEDKEVVSLAVWSKAPEEERPYWGAVARLIQQWLTTEHARRAVADEALDRYRELAFLNHIAFALNSSLNIKQVASTLVKECRKAVPSAKYGAVFLLEKNGHFKLLASFGEEAESIAEKAAETLLFREIVTSGKPEIVNQVGGDLRWNAFVPQIISFLSAN